MKVREFGRNRTAVRKRGGNALVEFALLCPFLFACLMATIELGRATQVDAALTSGARAGARCAISLSQGASSNRTTIQTAVNNNLTMENIPATSFLGGTLAIDAAGSPPTGASTNWSTWTPTWATYSNTAPPSSGSLVRVTVKAQAKKVTWLPMGGWFFGSSFYFQSNAVMRVP